MNIWLNLDIVQMNVKWKYSCKKNLLLCHFVQKWESKSYLIKFWYTKYKWMWDENSLVSKYPLLPYHQEVFSSFFFHAAQAKFHILFLGVWTNHNSLSNAYDLVKLKWVPENMYTFSIAVHIVNVYKFSVTHFNRTSVNHEHKYNSLIRFYYFD